MDDYTHSHQAKDYGSYYDLSQYTARSYDSMIGSIEQWLLERVMKKYSNRESPILDFACGTGRIAGYLEERGYKNIVGIDVSDEMLKIAKTKLKNTLLLHHDINRPVANSQMLNHFDCVVSFRFFLNAEDHLRNVALQALSALLKKDGILIFNIHKNARSFRSPFILLKNWLKKLEIRILNKKPTIFTFIQTLHPDRVLALLKNNDFFVVETYSYGYLPSFLSRLTGARLWIWLEKKLCRPDGSRGSHLLYVCRKND